MKKLMKPAALFAALLALVATIAIAQDQTKATVIRADGDPNTRVSESGTGTLGNNGDLYVTQTGAYLWVKSGGFSRTGWIQVLDINGYPAYITSGTNPAVSGTVAAPTTTSGTFSSGTSTATIFGTAGKLLATPTRWGTITISGTTYAVPVY